MAIVDSKNRPDFEHPDYVKQMPAMTVVRDVLGGTPAVQAKGEVYLPKGTLESQKVYEARLRTAKLYPATKRTWIGFLGLLFKDEPQLGEDVPIAIRGREATDGVEAVEGIAENIDLKGNSLSEFVKEDAGHGLSDGHAGILVDQPRAPKPADGKRVTIAEKQAAGIRPFWVAYTKDQIINWREKAINGRTVLTMLVLKECVSVPDGEFGSKEAYRYRVYRNDGGVVSVQVLEKIQGATADDVSFAAVEGYEKPITIPSQNEIPFAAMYGQKKGTFNSDPLLLGLAEENLRHYELRTDLRKLIKLSFPVIISKGKVSNLDVPEGARQDIAFSPDEILEIPPNPDTNVFMLEPSGTGIAPLAKEVQECESRMSRLGLSLLEPAQQSGKTNTEAATDQMEEQSELDFFRQSVKDCVEQALMFTAKFLGEKSGGSFEMRSALSKFRLTGEKLKAFSQMVAANQFPVEDFLTLLKVAGEVPEQFSVEQAMARLKDAIDADALRQRQTFDAGFVPETTEAEPPDSEDEDEEDSQDEAMDS